MSLVMSDDWWPYDDGVCSLIWVPWIILVECRITSHIYLPHTRTYLKTIIKQELLLIKQVDSQSVPCSTFKTGQFFLKPLLKPEIVSFNGYQLPINTRRKVTPDPWLHIHATVLLFLLSNLIRLLYAGVLYDYNILTVPFNTVMLLTLQSCMVIPEVVY